MASSAVAPRRAPTTGGSFGYGSQRSCDPYSGNKHVSKGHVKLPYRFVVRVLLILLKGLPAPSQRDQCS